MQLLAAMAGLGPGHRTNFATPPHRYCSPRACRSRPSREMLGHSSIRVTADVYGHLMEPARTEAADAMTEALWG